MQRTQIYLNANEAKALDQLAKRQRTTRSELIRNAIDKCYLAKPNDNQFAEIVEATWGAWRDDQTVDGADYVESLRRGRLASIHGQRNKSAKGKR